jgi:hypothetical protein
MANRAQSQKSCGNAGAVERVENQKQVSHSSHRPLEISPTPRDFHIPTAQAGRAWKSGKPKSGFPLSHTRPAMMTTIHFGKSKSKSKSNPSRRLRRRVNKTSKGEHHAAECRLHAPNFSGSPRIGIKTRFQAHSVLESKIDFRLTFGLENAPTGGNGVRF